MYSWVREHHLQKCREQWLLKKSVGLIKTAPEYARKYYEANKGPLICESTERHQRKCRAEAAAVATTRGTDHSAAEPNSSSGQAMEQSQDTETQDLPGEVPELKHDLATQGVCISKYQLRERKKPPVETSDDQNSGDSSCPENSSDSDFVP